MVGYRLSVNGETVMDEGLWVIGCWWFVLRYSLLVIRGSSGQLRGAEDFHRAGAEARSRKQKADAA